MEQNAKDISATRAFGISLQGARSTKQYFGLQQERGLHGVWKYCIVKGNGRCVCVCCATATQLTSGCKAGQKPNWLRTKQVLVRLIYSHQTGVCVFVFAGFSSSSDKCPDWPLHCLGRRVQHSTLLGRKMLKYLQTERTQLQ